MGWTYPWSQDTAILDALPDPVSDWLSCSALSVSSGLECFSGWQCPAMGAAWGFIRSTAAGNHSRSLGSNSCLLNFAPQIRILCLPSLCVRVVQITKYVIKRRLLWTSVTQGCKGSYRSPNTKSAVLRQSEGFTCSLLMCISNQRTHLLAPLPVMGRKEFHWSFSASSGSLLHSGDDWLYDL